MTDCWKEERRSRASFFQLIEKLEVIMQREAPYLDLNKHNDDHPHYNVPPESSGDFNHIKIWRRSFPNNQIISDQTILNS